MEYTKGKWINMDGAIECKIGDNAYKRIAHATPMTEVEQYKANANLISAAPDMYEACKALVKELELHTTQWDLGMKKLSAQGIQAITKAEGK